VNSKPLFPGNAKVGSACISVSTSKFLPLQERHQTDLFRTTISDEGAALKCFCSWEAISSQSETPLYLLKLFLCHR